MLTVSDNHIVLGGGGGGSGGGGGDVVGAASSTDNAIARFDGTNGKKLQDSLATVSDTGIVGSVGLRVTSSLATIAMGNSFLGLSGVFEGYNTAYGNLLVFRTVPSDGINPFFMLRSSADGITFVQDGSAYRDLRFNTGAMDRVAIKPNGFVGIGEMSPTAMLDINGTLRVRNNATFNGQFIDNVGSSGVDGQGLKKVGGKVVWADP